MSSQVIAANGDRASKRPRVTESLTGDTVGYQIGLSSVLDVVAANGVIGALDFGRIHRVSRALRRRCAEEEIAASVCRAQWPATAKIPPSCLSDNDGHLWLLRELSTRLTDNEGALENAAAAAQSARDEENSTWSDTIPLNDCLLLINFYDTATGVSLISEAFTGDDDLAMFQKRGRLKRRLPAPVPIRRKVVLKDNGHLEFDGDPPVYEAALHYFRLRDRTCRCVLTSEGTDPDLGDLQWSSNDMLDTHRVFLLGAKDVCNADIEWSTRKRLGCFTRMRTDIPLEASFSQRASSSIEGFKCLSGGFYLSTSAPCRSARVLGLGSALADFRRANNIDDEQNVVDGEEVVLSVHAERHVNEYWQGGRSDPKLTNFFEEAEKELSRQGTKEAVASVRRLFFFISFRTDFGSKDNFGASMGGITPTDVLESLV